MAGLIIKYTIIEAYKKHLFILQLSAFIACIVLGYYAKSISIIEGDASFLYFYNAAIRLTCIFLFAWYCIITQVQNFEKARLQMQMALPISRTLFCISTLLAYYLAALLIAFIATLPLMLMTDIAWLSWLYSFYLELIIIITLAFVLSLLFKHATTAISIFTLIYIFARNAAEFTRHANIALEADNSVFELISLWIIKITSLLVPKLENYASSVVLELGLNMQQLLRLSVESGLYIVLLFLIARLEIYKKVL